MRINLHIDGTNNVMFRADITFERYNFHLSVNIVLNPGTVTALIGPSGSGKSTLFRLLAGLESPSSGEIYSEDTCWFDEAKAYSLAIQQRKVGLVFQDYALFEHLTVYENIAYGVKNKKAADTLIHQWLEKTHLTHKAQAYPQALSGGEKQRVALARVLVTEPEILLLDEPFSALDITLRHDLRRELLTLIRDMQIPVLIATHDLLEARILADRVYVMSQGNILRYGETTDVFQFPQTTAAAKILGWQNILPTSILDASICKDLFENAIAVAVPVKSIDAQIPFLNLNEKINNPKKVNLSVIVTHCTNMGEYYLLESLLGDSCRLTFHLALGKKPKIDQKLHLTIDFSRVIPLFEASISNPH